MKSHLLHLIAILLSLTAVHAQSPEFQPGKPWPDDKGVHINAHGGGILLHDATYYWCGQFMVEGAAGNTAQVGVSLYSSRDLHQWKNEGIVLAVSDDPQSEIVKGCLIERPKIIFNRKTGKFVMWLSPDLRLHRLETEPARLSSADHIFGPWTELGDPGVGPPEQTRTTFDSQPTFVLPVQGKPGAFIYMADRWNPTNPIEATHIWLPVQFDKKGKPFLQWMDEWDLRFFTSTIKNQQSSLINPRHFRSHSGPSRCHVSLRPSDLQTFRPSTFRRPPASDLRLPSYLLRRRRKSIPRPPRSAEAGSGIMVTSMLENWTWSACMSPPKRNPTRLNCCHSLQCSARVRDLSH